MEKLWLIIKREYWTRVRRKSFILATLLTPLAFAVFGLVVGLIFSYSSEDDLRIAVIDEGNMLDRSLKDKDKVFFKFVDESLESLRENIQETDYDGILVIPRLKDVMDQQLTVYYYTSNQLSLDSELMVSQRIRSGLRNYKIDQLGLDRQQLEAIDMRISVEPEPLSEEDDDDSSMTSIIAAGIGMFMGFIMYLTVFIYGMMVMRSVMEENTNRIVEVMVSTVRPFELMLGKIIGVGAVGLTQVAIWAILIPLIMFVVNIAFGFNTAQFDPSMAAADIDTAGMEDTMAMAIHEISSQPWGRMIPLFIFYFLGGYLLYASLFAAVGSAMGDDMGEGQSLTIPITIPVILALYIMLAALQAPHSQLAIWSSLFPFFSPVVMPARLAFDPPLWQIITSVVILGISSLFFVWLSARIYRVGILMYGKKGSLKEMSKWIFRTS